MAVALGKMATPVGGTHGAARRGDPRISAIFHYNLALLEASNWLGQNLSGRCLQIPAHEAPMLMLAHDSLAPVRDLHSTAILICNARHQKRCSDKKCEN